MAEIKYSIRTYLCAQTGVTDIFGATADCRIHIDRKSDTEAATYPFAIIRTVTEAPDYAHDGALPDTGVYQIDIYSDAVLTADSGTTAIKTELSGFSGTMEDHTVGSSFIVNRRSDPVPDSKTFKRSLDVQIAQNG